MANLHFIDKISKVVERKYIAEDLHYRTSWHIKMITKMNKGKSFLCVLIGNFSFGIIVLEYLTKIAMSWEKFNLPLLILFRMRKCSQCLERHLQLFFFFIYGCCVAF